MKKNSGLSGWKNKMHKGIADGFIVLLGTVLARRLADANYESLFTLTTLWWTLFHLLTFYIAITIGKAYRQSYTYFCFQNLLQLTALWLGICVAETVFAYCVPDWDPSATAIYCMFLFIGLCATRTTARVLRTVRSVRFHAKDTDRTLIVGAGVAGATIARELRATTESNIAPVAFVDDDPAKQGLFIEGVYVAGTTDDVARLAEEYNAKSIIVAMPAVPAVTRRKIIEKCQVPGVSVKTLPGLYQLASGEVSVGQIRNVDVEDLLGREQVKVDLDSIMGYIEHKTVLVTGGGGSIGSELCRQIASHDPKKLIIFDIYENNAYDIEQELRRRYPDLDLLALIGSVRDKGRLESLFSTYHPEIVFNAAAHKHVPLMEVSPNEAVKNNVFGTLNVARCADKYGVERFVQISTDKAVNPTNVMGATKRICEMIIQTIGRHSKTEFVAVRFGNVLGSNGSVIPLFKKQIAEGGPVTVTHKDIIRYFMTIPEAVTLVLQAGAYAKGGQIYVLDMGEQVRIYDLAVNLIRLSGLEPGRDIEIKVTGLRPGEKLFEERLMDEEGMEKTANERICIGQPLEIDEDGLFAKLDELYEAAYSETDRMKELVHELVPTYTIDKDGHGVTNLKKN